MKKCMLIVMLVLLLSLTGCGIASLESSVNDIKGQLIGNSFECQFYDNYGEKFLTASGTKVGMTGNIIEEAVHYPLWLQSVLMETSYKVVEILLFLRKVD